MSKKFGIDIHGVLDRYGALLDVCHALVMAGHEVHVLTGPVEDLARKHLGALGAEQGEHYTHIFSIADHLIYLRPRKPRPFRVEG